MQFKEGGKEIFSKYLQTTSIQDTSAVIFAKKIAERIELCVDKVEMSAEDAILYCLHRPTRKVDMDYQKIFDLGIKILLECWKYSEELRIWQENQNGVPERKTITIDVDGENKELCFKKSTYCNGNVYVAAYLMSGEPWSDVTTNLGMELPPNMAFINVNSSADILDKLKEHRLIVDTGLREVSGYCLYPLCAFSKEFLVEWCEDLE